MQVIADYIIILIWIIGFKEDHKPQYQKLKTRDVRITNSK